MAEQEDAAALLRAALQGCPRCDYDEAEGGLFNHCYECCRKVTTLAYTALSAEPRVEQEDARRLDWLESWTEGGITLMAPGQHGGAVDEWLVVVDSGTRDARGYRWSEEAAGPTLRAAIDTLRATSPSPMNYTTTVPPGE